MIIDVKCDDGTTQIARTVLETDTTYTVNFLERNKYHLYDFMNINEVINKEASLNIPLYVKSANQEIILEPSEAYAEWTKSSVNLKESMNDLFNNL